MTTYLDTTIFHPKPTAILVHGTKVRKPHFNDLMSDQIYNFTTTVPLKSILLSLGSLSLLSTSIAGQLPHLRYPQSPILTGSSPACYKHTISNLAETIPWQFRGMIESPNGLGGDISCKFMPSRTERIHPSIGKASTGLNSKATYDYFTYIYIGIDIFEEPGLE